MTALPQASDTIVARATAPGAGAIAIVRLSGALTPRIVELCFRLPGGPFAWEERPPRQFHLGTWLSPANGQPVDEVQVVTAHTPHSYTGEDLCEVHCHGGPAVVEAIIQSALTSGARLAEPGEFTRRAFLNGRLDLAQAEAVCDLVTASTEAARRLAFRQIKGKVSQEIEALRSQVVSIAAEIEARLDFADEDVPPLEGDRIRDELQAVANAVATAIRHAQRGRRAREGARVVICGRPNTGKSSLLNALAGRERAIVTPHPGATRDTIECTLDLAGYALILIDTAGLRETADPIEREGVSRTRRELETADLILWLIDASEPLTDEDAAIAADLADRPHLILLNKIDLPPRVAAKGIAAEVESRLGFATGARASALEISALRGDGLEALERLLLDRLIGARDGAAPTDASITNLRHIEQLQRAAAALRRAYNGFIENLSGEFIMVDLTEALAALGEILGHSVSDEILNHIFQNFCMGK